MPKMTKKTTATTPEKAPAKPAKKTIGAEQPDQRAAAKSMKKRPTKKAEPKKPETKPEAPKAEKATGKVLDQFPAKKVKQEQIATLLDESLDHIAEHAVKYDSDAAAISISFLSTLDLIAELARRKDVPVGALRKGEWFCQGQTHEAQSVGVKLDGGIDACETKVVFFKRHGKDVREAPQGISTMAMVRRIPAPSDTTTTTDETGKIKATRVTTPVAAKAGSSTALKAGTPRKELLGHSMTGVVRWMGSKGWDFDRAWKVLQAYGCQTTDASVRTFLRAGQKGERGPLPQITSEQAKELESK